MMNISQNKIKSCTDIGDTVYVIAGCEYKPAIVKSIGIDAIETDLDTLFYDEIGEQVNPEDIEKLVFTGSNNEGNQGIGESKE